MAPRPDTATAQLLTNAILSAAKENDVARVSSLLEANASPDAANMIDQSALHIASLWGSLDVVKLLIGAGANPNAKNRFGAAPLHCAAQRSQVAVGEFLVQHGADPALVAGNGLAPYEMVADEALRPAFGAPRTELHLAAAAPDPVPALEAVLRAPGIDVNSVDERGDTALAIVARRCHAAACALLLERGATTGAYNRDGMSALHIASSLPLLPGAGSPPETGGAPAPEHIVAVVRLLLEGRADPNAPTRARGEYTSGAWERREADGSTSRVTDVGVSCLQLAVEASGGIPEVATLLLDAGARIDVQSGASLCTPLHAAIEASLAEPRRLDLVRALLARGADANLGNRDIGLESSPLHDAAQRSDVPLARLLLGARADANKAGKAGMRPLHLAARTGTAEIAQLLLEAGADASVADARGKLAADYAEANPRQAPVLELLRKSHGGPACPHSH